MSGRSYKNINQCTSKVSELKNNFINLINSNPEAALDILKEMRINLGLAIYYDEISKKNIINKSKNKISEDDLINLSASTSQIYCIHSNIRYCEKLLYKNKQGYTTNTLMSDTTGSDNVTLNSNADADADIPRSKSKYQSQSTYLPVKYNDSNMSAKSNIGQASQKRYNIRPGPNGTDDVISIQGLRSESDYGQLLKQTGGDKEELVTDTDNDPINTTEYINNLTTTEARNLETNIDNNTGSAATTDTEATEINPNNPTLVNYWADWCPASNRFLTVWNEFKKNYKQDFPDLNVISINVQKNPELQALATKVGVVGYPSLILFYNNKIYKKTGGTPLQEIKNFINGIING